MTQIDFYTNAADKLSTACRIIAKAYGLGHRIVVACPDAELAHRIDRLLWTTPATGFMPHCAPESPLARETPVIIDARDGEPVHDQVLVNLRGDRPQHFSRFERLIEIVTLDESDKALARERFRFYKERGYAWRSHDLKEGGAA